MAVPYTFGTATAAIPLSQLDSNFATAITIGNTAVQLGNTVTTLNNMTLANVTISSGTVTITNVAVTTANVSGTANISTLVVVGNETVGGNTTITGNITAANANVTSNLVLSGGTANGVAYLNGSKVLTSGSALTFDGTTLTAPQMTLTSSNGLTMNSASGGLIDSSGNTLFIQFPAANSLIFRQSGSPYAEYMRLTSTGLGIGASSPAYKLEVVAPAGDNITALFRSGDATAANNAGGGFRSASSATATSRLAQMWLDADGANFGGADYFYIDKAGNSGEVSLFQQSNAAMTFHTNATKRMTLDASGIVTMNAYGAGAATFSAAGVISSVSDETWKIKDGVPIDPDSMLKKLEPGYWFYNNEKKEIFGVDRQLGFYAQNVNVAIGPEAAPVPETTIIKNKDGTEATVTKPWGYYDRSVLAVTVMSLQKALATIELLTARITALEGA